MPDPGRESEGMGGGGFAFRYQKGGGKGNALISGGKTLRFEIFENCLMISELVSG